MIDWPDLPKRALVTLEAFRETIGETHSTPWVQLDQAAFDGFAEVTGDDAVIHTDPVIAAKTRFGGTIAHGLLVLSLLPRLLRWAMPNVEGARTGVNYGFDNVRFLAPVPCGARVRAHFRLAAIEPKPHKLWVICHDVTVELENSKKPALSASWKIGRWIDSNA